jgi:prepilin-type N-terminal cleavage/methylation domain-containing protein
MSKNGFTLVEVLITIAVIGVVAAITIPALHKKITKFVLKKQIRKAMALVAQSQRAAAADVGVPTYNSGDYVYGDYNTAFLNNFKFARICKGNGLRDGCVPEYEGLPTSSWSGFQKSGLYNKQTIYQTMDGMILVPYASAWLSYWLIDVNGLKGPNKAGWDLFFFSMSGGRPNWTQGPLNQNKDVKGGIYPVNFSTLEKW